MRKLRIGTTINELNGTPVLDEDSELTIRRALTRFIRNLKEDRAAMSKTLVEVGKKVHEAVGEWVELENAEYNLLKEKVDTQLRSFYVVIVSVPIQEAFDEAERLYREGLSKAKKSDGP